MSAVEDRDRGHAAMATFWVMTTVAFFVVAARLYIRVVMRTIGTDDWLMLATLILLILLSVIVTWEACIGGFRHLLYVPKQHVITVALLNYLMQLVAVTSFATAKASVGYLILRLLGPENVWRKRIVWFVIVFTTLVNAINIILTFAQCDPPKALWDRKVKAHCWNPNVQLYFAYFICSENIVADFVLALLPLGMIWNMKLDFKRKAVLCGLLSLGWCAGIAGITKTNYLSELTVHSDLTWVTYDVVVWSGAEDFVIILCGSAPTLRPLWDRYHGNGEPLAPCQYHSQISSDLEKNGLFLKRISNKQSSFELRRSSQQQESCNIDGYKMRTTTEFHIDSEHSSET